MSVVVRRETAADVEAIRAVTAAAFADPTRPGAVPVEVRLVDALRAGDAWLPRLSWVAEASDGAVVGHVVCSRGRVGSWPVLGLGPLSVQPSNQRQGVGSALVHAVLGAADALDESLVALLGDPAYYGRFGFVPSEALGIAPPVAGWRSHFQVRALTAYDPAIRGAFAYAEAFPLG